MFWALVIPELMLAWSAKQWWMAGEIADTYNREKVRLTRRQHIRFWAYVKKLRQA
jgi:sulfite reductase beta subunit-like hemoprotein